MHKSKVIETLAFALRLRSDNSFRNILFVVCISGCLFLKMKSFLTDQIAQHIKNATIMKKTG